MTHKPTIRCIYCNQNKPPSPEHYLPACLGKFENFDCLDDRICVACNNEIGRQLEDQFCRSGDIGFMRYRLGIGGRSSHKTKVNPFERGSSGAGALQMTGKIPGQDREVRLQLIKGTKTIEYVPQVILITESGEQHYVPIPDDMTDPSQLQKKVEALSLDKLKQLSLIATKSDIDRIQKLASALPVQVDSGAWEDLPMTGSTYTWTKLVITSKFFRAIAKIGFHYLLKHLPSFRGDEDFFGDIRRFIMEGGDVSQFVTWEGEDQILGDVKNGLVPPVYSHIVTAAAKTREIVCRLQFFLGPDSIPPVYRVRIGSNNTSPLYTADSGHFFGYYSDGPKNGTDGFMISLLALPIERPPR